MKLRSEVKTLSQVRSDEKIEYITASLCQSIGSSEEILQRIKQAHDSKSWQKKTGEWDINNGEFQKIRDLIIATNLPYLLEDSDRYIASFSKNIR